MAIWRTGPQDRLRSFLAKRPGPQSFKILGPLTALPIIAYRVQILHVNQISPSDDEGPAEVVLADALCLLVAVGGGLADAAQARKSDVVVGRRALPRVLAWKIWRRKGACSDVGLLYWMV